MALPGALLAAAVGVTVAIAGMKLPGSEITPAGYRQTTSVYVKMRDGIEIAVTILLPPDLKPGERVPALMRTTRYWRGSQIGWGLRMMLALRFVNASNLVDQQGTYFTRRHFAVLVADARGSGASGGKRLVEYSPAEVTDMGEVAAWAAHQPWSNGRIGTFGVSYDGNTAELAAAANQPAIVAVMPLYDDFDSQALIQPGGIALRRFIEQWSKLVAALDRDDVCGADEVKGWDCWKDRQMTPGVLPVDADRNGEHLAQLVREHHNTNVGKAVGKAEFRDDLLSTESGDIRFSDISPYGLRKRIEASNVPMMVWCGWLDADSCQGALIRYRTFSNPQQVVIGPLSHGGSFNVDPFAEKHLPPVPLQEEQFDKEADFFDRTLRSKTNATIASFIQYYTMGEGKWHTTKVWPPEGLSSERLYFGEGKTLTSNAPAQLRGKDSYAVDFTASSGTQTRWHTQLGGGDVVYPDRATEDKKLLTYTSAPLGADVEITGSPVLTLEIASTTTDGAIHAYLEDLAPTGRVTYLDEGILRVIHRKEVDPRSLPYELLGPAHSFQRADAEPMRPGEVARIRFSLFPTSVLLREGHSIRVALAGADASLFQRYPAWGTPTWTIYRENGRSSSLEFLVKNR
ncbi:MAG: CocE/NonD family hydrolase [Acidobacteria bacterium]|nr:CocE/NonD family hydrolase [Acidobacteriota bacterium]